MSEELLHLAVRLISTTLMHLLSAKDIEAWANKIYRENRNIYFCRITSSNVLIERPSI